MACTYVGPLVAHPLEGELDFERTDALQRRLDHTSHIRNEGQFHVNVKSGAIRLSLYHVLPITVS